MVNVLRVRVPVALSELYAATCLRLAMTVTPMPDGTDARSYAPATQRNRDPILAVLQQVLPPTGTVLEISSGTGEHAVYFAPRLAPRHWLPSDANPLALESIEAWRQAQPADLLYPPIPLDASASRWPIEDNPAAMPIDFAQHPITAIVNINMIHIAPWSAGLGLMAGAGRLLPAEGILYLYGPYRREGQHTAPSNAEFDAHLKAQNPEWGLRDLEMVVAAAQAEGLALVDVVPMPANNLSVIFRRQ